MSYQKFPDSKALARDLESKKLEKIYLFIGEEEGEKEKFITRIIDNVIEDEDEKNYSTGRFHSEYGELNSALEFIHSDSMFSNTKVCLLLNINSLKSKGDDAAVFSDLVENMSESNILILTSSENKIPAVINGKLLKKIKIIQFWKLFENDIASYLIKSLKKNNIEINRHAVDLLIDLTGRDIKKVDEAIFKIINSGEKIITTDMIRYLIPDDKDISVFEFIDSLFQKKKNTFNYLSKVLDSGQHELAVLKLLMRQAELIEKYHYLSGEEQNCEAVLMELGITHRNKNTFLKCVETYSPGAIKKVFPLIYKTDYRLKSNKYSGNLVSNPIFDLVSEMLMEKRK